MGQAARTAAGVAGAAAAMSLLLGCTGHSDDAPARRPASDIRAGAQADTRTDTKADSRAGARADTRADTEADVRAVARTGTSRQVLDVAEQLLERDCMRRHGFRFWVVAPATARRDFPYVLDDIGWARTHGYGAEQRAALRRAAAIDPNKHYLLSLPPDRRTAVVAALNGPRPDGLTADLPNGVRVTHSDTGCTAEAERRLYGDLPAWFRATRTTTVLTGERMAAVQQDQRYLDAREDWARCMKAAGQPYTDPRISRATAERGVSRAREIRLAVAEATCARSTGLSRVAAAVDRSYDTRLRQRYPGAYGDLARLTEAALPRARALIARG
ncbi:hypothetical protein GT045_27360 [Streptomyces sp. SID486]|uniref:hypothetical protein n=1 Tax=Streptomyces sp. SID486 TaxID=2690264 RepID=UPI00136856CB|nr:hypothetical protein [Streptomyces sp. SID486]MYX98421.1 hypothetical protein [Streptomyces sp. SID486]